jgi:lysophospholipase L1-like esterase
MKRNLLLLSFYGLIHLAQAQDTVSYSNPVRYDFLQQEDNLIHNSVSLAPFYDSLYQLKNRKKTIVNILHIGDSHIQADYLTGATRKLFQQEFGNAGRGLVFPGHVGRTNEPPTLYSSSSAPWDASRIIYGNQSLPIGIGAMTLQTKQHAANLLLRTRPAEELSYAFNRITLLYQKDFSSYNLEIRDSAGHAIAWAGPYTMETKNTSRIQLPHLVNQIELTTLSSSDEQAHLTLFGLVLENGNPGICYHATGGNGAKIKHFLEARLFVEQTTVLAPALIIISLGTNEAIDHPFVDPTFTEQLDTFIHRLKSANPHTQLLLTVPMDFYKKKTRRNPGVEVIRTLILNYANINGIAYWDLYAVGGGKHAADLWKDKDLLQPDGVHFTKAGYALQGSLLYEALIKGYNEYVRFRYP